MIPIAFLERIVRIIGNMTDTLVEAVGTGSSVMSYVKGLVQLLAQLQNRYVALGYTNNTGYVDVLNISDKGVLTGVHQTFFNGTANSIGKSGLKIIIDGVTILETTKFAFASCHSSVNIMSGQGGSMSFFHRFNSSLIVQHSSSVGNNFYVETTVAYTTD